MSYLWIWLFVIKQIAEEWRQHIIVVAKHKFRSIERITWKISRISNLESRGAVCARYSQFVIARTAPFPHKLLWKVDCSWFCGWNFNSLSRKFKIYFLVSSDCVSRFVFVELLSSLFWSIGSIVHRSIVGSRSIYRGILVYSRQLFHLPLKDTRFYHRKTKKTRAPCLYYPLASP